MFTFQFINETTAYETIESLSPLQKVFSVKNKHKYLLTITSTCVMYL